MTSQKDAVCQVQKGDKKEDVSEKKGRLESLGVWGGGAPEGQRGVRRGQAGEREVRRGLGD